MYLYALSNLTPLPDFITQGIGYESVNYGISNFDSYSQKEHTKIHKIPTFGDNQASFHWDTAIVKINKEMYGQWPLCLCLISL